MHANTNCFILLVWKHHYVEGKDFPGTIYTRYKRKDMRLGTLRAIWQRYADRLHDDMSTIWPINTI